MCVMCDWAEIRAARQVTNQRADHAHLEESHVSRVGVLLWRELYRFKHAEAWTRPADTKDHGAEHQELRWQGFAAGFCHLRQK